MNGSAKNASSSFTFSLRGTGSDGSQASFNSIEHVTVNACGIVNEFVFEDCY